MGRSRVPTRIGLFVLGTALVEAGAVSLFGPEGHRLRALVDLYTIQGLVLSVIGTILFVDRPFLASRVIRQRASGEPADPPVSKSPAVRLAGYVLAASGVGLFALSALLWWLRSGT